MDRSTARVSAVRLCAGNGIEWFESSVYATCSVFFSGQFFGGGASDPTLATLAVFAVGFCARPVGGVLFGWWADRSGRRIAMLGSMALVAVAGLAIGLVPNYRSIGPAAPTVLIVARLAQGLGAGGELPAAQTYLVELAPPGRRGLWGSFIHASGSLGVLAATLLAAILTSILTRAQMADYGWRIPFILGALMGLYVLIMRARLPETEQFHRARQRSNSRRPGAIRGPVLARPGLLLRALALVAGMTVPYYVWAVAAPSFAVTERHTDPGAALWAATTAILLSILALPAWGALSDKIGRRPVLIIPRVALPVLLAPLDSLVQGQAWQLLVTMTLALGLISASAAIHPAVMAELFPTNIRATGSGLPNAVAIAAFGGTAPYLHAYLSHTHRAAIFTAYAATLCLLSLAAVLSLPETKDQDLDLDSRRDGRPGPASGVSTDCARGG